MQSPFRFGYRIGSIGQPLSDPFFTFGANSVQFRRSATSMIAGRPGSFKSVLALNMLVHWAKEGIGALYLSADSDEFTVVKRLSGILTATNLDTVESSLMAGGDARARYERALRQLDGTEFEYKQLDMAAIALHVKSYEEVYGAYPTILFIDNLINMVDYPDDWGGMLAMCRDLDKLARKLRIHVCILHHAKLGPGDNSQPPADWEIQGKLTQIPRLVLTTAATGTQLKIACVKNTNGEQHPDGKTNWNFQVYTSMKIQELDFTMGRI